jgi:hypothetical protein
MPSAVTSPGIDPLDELLPTLAALHAGGQGEAMEWHRNASVLEVSDRAQLTELAADPKIRRFLLARLSDTVALVDPGCAEALARALLAEGQTPKRVRGGEE